MVRKPVFLPLVVAALATALLTMVGVGTLQASNRTVLGDAQVRVSTNRDAAVRSITRQTDDFERTVSAFAALPGIRGALVSRTAGSRTTAELALSALAASKNAPSAFLVDTGGRVVAGYPAQQELMGRSFAYRDWFRGASTTGRPYVSVAFRTAAPGRPLVVAVSSPVVNGGHRVGYLTVLWQLDAVRNLVSGARRDAGVVIGVTDQSGQSLSSSPSVADRGQSPSASVLAATEQALAGRSVNVVDSTSVAAAGPVPRIGWTVTAVLPRSLALAPAAVFRRSLGFTLGASLFFVLVALVVAIRFSRRRGRELEWAEEQRRHLDALFAASPVGIIRSSPEGAIVAVNQSLAHLLGYDSDDLIGRTIFELLDPGSASVARAEIRRLLDQERSQYTGERVYRARDGTAIPVLVSVIVVRGGSEGPQLVAFVVDQVEQRAAVEALRSSDERFRRIFDEGLIGKLLVAPDGVVTGANATATRLLGGQLDNLVGSLLVDRFVQATDRRAIGDLLTGSDNHKRLRAEMAVVSTTGQILSALVAMSWLVEGSGQRHVLVQIEDVTARRVAEQRLAELALHDDLTGLANRRLLLERCVHAFTIARSARTSSSSVAMLFIDLDGFKPVNDRAGHAAGDEVLRAVAADLLSAVRPTDTVARIGGDEFVVLLAQVESLEYARRVAERVTSLIRRWVEVGEPPALRLSASVGVAVADVSREIDLDPDQLLRRADAAMYRAKAGGRDRHDMFQATA